MSTRNDRTLKRQRRKRYRWIAFIVLIIILGGGSYYYFNMTNTAQAQPEEAALQTAKVRTGDIVISLNGVGEVLPQNDLSVGFQNNGIIKELSVTVGDVVEEGQVLAKLDDSNAALQLSQALLNLEALTSSKAIAEAELAIYLAQDELTTAQETLKYLISPSVYYWETELERLSAEMGTLQNNPNASQTDLDAAQTALDSAQTNLNQALVNYQAIYLPENFNFTYTDLTTGVLAVDPVSGEYLLNLIPPTENEIALARAAYRDEMLNVQETQLYLHLLKGEEVPENLAFISGGTKIVQLNQAKLAVESAQLALENTVLKAPISGTITRLDIRVGQASGTNPIIDIKSIDQMMLSFYLEESALPYVTSGKRIIARFDAYPDLEINGQILNIDPSLITKDGDLVIHGWASLEIPQDVQLLTLMSAEIEVIAAETYDALVIPVQAIRELAPGSNSVFVVGENEQLEMRIVTIGIKDFANVEILSGLSKGEIVSTGTVETAE